LRLNAAEGITPAQIEVDFEGLGLGPGTHWASITVTSPDLPGQSVTIQVEASNPHGSVGLPLILRG
jgi:hypothetical protein